MPPGSSRIAVIAAVALAFGLGVGATRVAHAQAAADVVAAEKALEDLRYEDAARLLERAWLTGGLAPVAVRRVLRLQGEVAATLGDDAGARLAFARWRALEPEARLPEGTSPKIQATFDAAGGELAGRRLRVSWSTTAGEATVELVVDDDPMGQIAGARASWRGAGGVRGSVEAHGGARMRLPLPSTGRWEVVLTALDSQANRLVELGAEVPIVIGRDPVPVVPPPGRGGAGGAGGGAAGGGDGPGREGASGRSLWGGGWPWLGGAVLAGGTATFFGVRAYDAQEQLDALNAASDQHDFTAAQEVERRLRRDVLWTNVSLGAVAVFTVVAVVQWLRPAPRRGSTRARLVPGGDAGAGAAAAAWEWRF